MEVNYINWENDHNNWEDEIRLWQEVYDIVDELVGGVRNPEEWGELPHQQDINASLKEQLNQNLERLTKEKKHKLIEVLLTIDGKTYESKKMVSDKKDIKITIDDIKLIANNYLNIEIEFLK